MSTTLTPAAGHTVAVPFVAQPVGRSVSFVVFLSSNAAGTAIVAQSTQTAPVASNGLAQQSPPVGSPGAAIDLSNVAAGDYYTGVALYIGVALISTTMLGVGTTVTVEVVAVIIYAIGWSGISSQY